jgi:hypothetical protein
MRGILPSSNPTIKYRFTVVALPEADGTLQTGKHTRRA